MNFTGIKNNKITIEVALSNSLDLEIYEPVIRNSICAVIDTITAASSISAIFGSQCSGIILSENKNKAYKLKEILKDHLLCGEEEFWRL
jgi:phosphosulfolactate phosphohydrolase-like enzyme